VWSATSPRPDRLKLPDRSQAYLGISNIGDRPGSIPQTMILLSKQTAADFLSHQAQRRPRAFQMFTGLMNRCVIGVSSPVSNLDRIANFRPASPPNAIGQRFVRFKFVAHLSGVFSSLAR